MKVSPYLLNPSLMALIIGRVMITFIMTAVIIEIRTTSFHQYQRLTKTIWKRGIEFINPVIQLKGPFSTLFSPGSSHSTHPRNYHPRPRSPRCCC